ncbi:MAG: 50S ribosomal protein L24 [bacterium]|nr:50S ribosomal protein L24 [bacterium]
MIKIKTGDTVRVTAGKSKGMEGKVEKVNPVNMTAIVPGANLYKRAVKTQGDVKGGMYDIPRALSFGKIAVICPKCKKITRVGFSTIGGSRSAGKFAQKVRICRKCGKEIDSK